MKMEAEISSETSATYPTLTGGKTPKARTQVTITCSEIFKSVVTN
jgi:hypothetical protein